MPQGIKVKNFKALPDDFDIFNGEYIDSVTSEVKNIDSLRRRIIGLSSYFRSAQEGLLPKFNKTPDDYHIIKIPMSNFQFKIYEDARKEERKLESKSKKPNTSKADEIYKEPTSTYRIFSRLYCNYVMPNRPTPGAIKREQIAKGWQEPVWYKDGKIVEKEEKEEKEDENPKFGSFLKEAKKAEDIQDINEERR